MEPPASWDALTAALAVASLSRPLEAWAFLCWRGLVRDGTGDSARFIEIVRAQIDRGDITGPSLALRVRMEIAREGFDLPAAEAPDPGADRARADIVRFTVARSDRAPNRA